MRVRDYSHQVGTGDHAVQFNPLFSITWSREGGHYPFWRPSNDYPCNLLLQFRNFSRIRGI